MKNFESEGCGSLGMANNTYKHNIIAFRIKQGLISLLPSELEYNVVNEYKIAKPHSKNFVEPDISFWQDIKFVGEEIEPSNVLCMIELVHNSDNERYTKKVIEKAFLYADSLQEAFMYNYEKRVWYRFRRNNGCEMEVCEDWSEVFKLHLNDTLEGTQSRPNLGCAHYEYVYDPIEVGALDSVCEILLGELKKISSNPMTVQKAKKMIDPNGSDLTVTPSITVFENVSFEGGVSQLNTPLMVVDIIDQEEDKVEFCVQVTKSMKYHESIEEGFVYNLQTHNWIRFSRDSDPSFLVMEDDNCWCRTFRVHLGKYLRRWRES